MKRVFIILSIIILSGLFLYSQTPQAFKYQGVARDTSGNILANVPVAFQISILQGDPSGSILFSERHSTITNEYGLASLEIGRGVLKWGSFTEIDWSYSPLFLRIELDQDGGYAYVTIGTSELLSVPYALYSRGSSETNMLSDVDGDTKIHVEKNPDEDIIRFDIAGDEKMILFSKRLELLNSENNVFIGEGAGFSNTSGFSNVGIGTNTLFNCTNQNYLVGIGESALFNNGIGALGVEGIHNTAIGGKSLFSNTKGYWCTGVGYESLYSNTEGSSNTAIGYQAMTNNDVGSFNLACGFQSMYSNTTGDENTAFGYHSLDSNTTGNRNTAIGQLALHHNIEGDNNVAIGNQAGFWETESSRLFIDNQARSNQQVARNSALIYGVFHSYATDQRLTINGFVGILTTNPTAELEVNGLTKTGGLETEGYANIGGSLTVDGWTTTEVLEITGTGGSDLAEPFEISDPNALPAGSVVVIDENKPGALKLSTKAYDPLVAGILSGAGGLKAGITLGQLETNSNGQNVALSGRVYVLANTENGSIKPGDKLTTSNTPGHAMKATDVELAVGSVIGKAMSSLVEGEGLVLVLVNLQ